MDSNHRRCKPADLQSAPFGHSGILPFLMSLFRACCVIASYHRHSLPRGNSFLLSRIPCIHRKIAIKSIFSAPAALNSLLRKSLHQYFNELEPMEGIEPTTPRLQITCSGQLSYIGIAFPKGIANIEIISHSPKLFSLFIPLLSFFSFPLRFSCLVAVISSKSCILTPACL